MTEILRLFILDRLIDSLLQLIHGQPEAELLTVEPRLTTTPFIRPPGYYGHILSNQT